MTSSSAESDASLPTAPTKQFTNAASGSVSKITAEMDRPPKVGGWLEAGEDRLVACVDDFTAQLGVRAVKIARDRQATAIDARDVETANEKLLGVGAERRAYWVALAGVSGGAAIAAVFAIGLAASVRGAYRWWIAIGLLGLLSLTLFVIALPRRR